MTRISVVIPAFNEARYLPRLLDTLDIARARHEAGAAAVEVIVADNGSTDATVDIATARGCVVVHVAPRVIAAVRNGGARAARGPVLAFVDADTQVHPETFNAIDACFSDLRHIVGITGVVPERHSRGIDTTMAGMHALARLAGTGPSPGTPGMPPTGVVCCRKDDWAAVGGYREGMLFAEDVWFGLDLIRRGRKDGRRFGWIAGAPAIFSMRKFDTFGDWHYATFPFRLAGALVSRGPIRRFAERYWYGTQRG